MKNLILLLITSFLWSQCFSQHTLKITGGNLKITGDVDIVLKDAKWVNNGTFTATNGTVHLTGTASATNAAIEGTQMTTFYNLTINKSSNNAQLNRSAKVSNMLYLQSGLLDIGNFDLDFGTAGTTTVVTGQTYIHTSGSGKVAVVDPFGIFEDDVYIGGDFDVAAGDSPAVLAEAKAP